MTPSMILQLHRMLTDAILDNANKVGQYWDPGDDIHVTDAFESVLLHTPPEASELPGRIERLCRFANACPEQGRRDWMVKSLSIR